MPPKFIKENNGPYAITEAALFDYAESLKATKLPAEFQDVPEIMVSNLDKKTSQKFVYIGMHHTFYHLIDDSRAKEVPFVRGPPDVPLGKGKLNSIFSNGILPSSFEIRELLFGPGVYLTQRPAVGNLAVAGGLLNLSEEEKKNDVWEIVQIHVFVPLETYKSWERVSIKPIADGGGVFKPGSEIEAIRREDDLNGQPRQKYKLSDEDVIIAKPSVKDAVVEEIAVSGKALEGAKLLAEVVRPKEDFLSYMDYRSKHRHAKRPPGVEWSEVAVRVLEHGDKESGVNPIKDTGTYKDLKQYLVNFEDLKEEQSPHRYWQAFESMPERNYNYLNTPTTTATTTTTTTTTTTATTATTAAPTVTIPTTNPASPASHTRPTSPKSPTATTPTPITRIKKIFSFKRRPKSENGPVPSYGKK